MRRWITLAGILTLVVLGGAAFEAPPRARAQADQPGVAFWDLGGSTVSGKEWDFSGDFAISAGAWESITISNYGYCFVGPNDPRAGTAHAAAVYWFTELTPQMPMDSTFTYTGTLMPGRGGNVAGQVTISSTQGPDAATQVDITLSGSNLSFLQDNTLEACLLGSS